MTPGEARDSLNTVIREQLSAAYQRGVKQTPYGVGALADTRAADAFRSISIAVSSYTGAIAENWGKQDSDDQDLASREAGT